MRVLWQQIVKDVRLLKWPLATWLVVLAATHAVVLFAGSQAWPTSLLLRRAGEAQNILVSLAACVFVLGVALLVQHDAPSSHDAFWLTRPISRRVMLAAKLLIGVAFFVAAPLAADAIDHLWFGLGPTYLAAPMPATVFAWLLALMAVAAATTGVAQFVLVTIFEVVLFGGVLGAVESMRGLGQPDFRALLGLVALFGVALTAFAYLRRRPRATAVALGSAPVVLAAITVILWPSSRTSLRAAADTPPCGEAVGARVDRDDLSLVEGFGADVIQAPVRFSGLGPGTSAVVTSGSGDYFDTADQRIALGRIILPRNAPMSDQRVREALAPAIGEGFTLHNVAALPSARPQTVLARVPGQRLANVAGLLHLEATVALYRYEREAVLAPSVGASYQSAKRAARILQVSVSGQRISAHLRRARSASATETFFTYPSVYALRVQALHQAILAAPVGHAGIGFLRTGVMTMLLPVPQNLSLDWLELDFDTPWSGRGTAPDARAWLQDSDLVVIASRPVVTCRLVVEFPGVRVTDLPREPRAPLDERPQR